MAASTEICGFLDALLDYQLQLLASLNAKFNALRRFARLLEQLADLTSFIPDFTKLLKLSNLNLLSGGLASYSEMVNACPFLNLPKPPFNADLAKLQGELDRAYANLIAVAGNNNWMRINELQGQLDKFQSKMNLSGAIGSDYLRCAIAICRTAEAAEDTLKSASGFTRADAIKIATDFKNNFVDNVDGIVSDVARQKIAETKATMAALQSLRDVPSLPAPISYRPDADRRLMVAQYSD